MAVKGQRFRYRFTFFQRQFVSHLIVCLLILGLLSAGFAYYLKQQALSMVTVELTGAAKVIARQMVREEEEPTGPIQSYRNLLSERKISFIVLDKSGEIVFRDPKMPTSMRSKPFLDGFRSHIFTMKDNQSFIVERNTELPLVVVTKPIHLKTRGDLYLFIFSPLEGFQETQKSLDRALIWIIAVVFAVAVWVGWLVSRNLSRTIQSLRQATRQIAAGYYEERLQTNRTDELGDLSLDFNRIAERLEQASHKLKLYEQRRQHFIMDITHELRTPLTSIRGIIEGLKTDLVTRPEDKQKYYAIIEKETFRLIRLINELLDMEKIDAGTVTLHASSSSLREIMNIVAESLKVLTESKKLRLIIECGDEVTVYGDYDRLIQIMINLIKNSIQFTDCGTIRLKGSDNESSTFIEIVDTGRGMTAEELSLIWDRFYKADPSRAKNSSETGLGLSIVKRLVESHSGTIEAESTAGLGSSFRIVLPKGAAQEPPSQPIQG
ncbi:sensor histidine kinase [Paenibacillus piri]|uniref:histidine kinase n=1 Tax=Paenibacillus piri TaxID=2547395 RepID=A0A4R5KCN9_9BACL|nr:HAMP domain-containing sensor histidine kinase [Paenibacillus piri]TDF91840.1 HAMP domain-containing histidine kinase [Paenibacillus piri]